MHVGNAPKLEEQLQTLLNMLKTATDLPRGSALAEELEAVASKLREKEEVRVPLTHFSKLLCSDMLLF